MGVTPVFRVVGVKRRLSKRLGTLTFKPCEPANCRTGAALLPTAALLIPLPRYAMRLPHLMSPVLALVFCTAPLFAQATATPADLDRLTGPGWVGTLTYRDYTTEARTTIKAAPLIRRLGDARDGSAQWEFKMSYADEPHANTGDTLRLAADGRRFRGVAIVERQQLSDGRVRVVTEGEGQDNERPARVRTVYIIGERAASLQKLVRYEGAEFFERHIYEWVR